MLASPGCSGGGKGIDNGTGQVTLTWDAPTTNTDGTPISYFTGDYKVYYGTTSGNYTAKKSLNISGQTVTCQITNLAPERLYFFVVTAINTLGHESVYSREISKSAKAVSQNSLKN